MTNRYRSNAQGGVLPSVDLIYAYKKAHTKWAAAKAEINLAFIRLMMWSCLFVQMLAAVGL